MTGYFENQIKNLVKLLIGNELLDEERLAAFAEQVDFIESLYLSKAIEEDKLIWLFSKAFDLPIIPNLTRDQLDSKVIGLLPTKLIREIRCLPYIVIENYLSLVTYRPLPSLRIDEIKRITGFEIEQSLVGLSVINALIEEIFGAECLEQETEKHFISDYLRPKILERFENDYSCDLLFELLLEKLIATEADRIAVDSLTGRTQIYLIKDDEYRRFLTVDEAWSAVVQEKFRRVFSIGEGSNDGMVEFRDLVIQVGGRALQLNLVVNEVSNGLVFSFGPSLGTTKVFTERVSPASSSRIVKAAEQGGIIFLCGNKRGMSEHYHNGLLEMLSEHFHRVVVIGNSLKFGSDNFIQLSTGLIDENELFGRVKAILPQQPEIVMITSTFSERLLAFCLDNSFSGMTFILKTSFKSGRDLISFLVNSELNRNLIALTTKLVHSRWILPGICRHCREEIVPDLTIEHHFGRTLDHNLYTTRGCPACRIEAEREPIVLEEALLMNRQLRDCLANAGDNLSEVLTFSGFRRIYDNFLDLVEEGFLDADFLHQYL